MLGGHYGGVGCSGGEGGGEGNIGIVFVQSLSHDRLFVTPWTAAHQAPLSFTVS